MNIIRWQFIKISLAGQIHSMIFHKNRFCVVPMQ